MGSVSLRVVGFRYVETRHSVGHWWWRFRGGGLKDVGTHKKLFEPTLGGLNMPVLDFDGLYYIKLVHNN